MKPPRRKIVLPHRKPAVDDPFEGATVDKQEALPEANATVEGVLITPTLPLDIRDNDVFVQNDKVYAAWSDPEYDTQTGEVTVEGMPLGDGEDGTTEMFSYSIDTLVRKVNLENLLKVVNGQLVLPARSSRSAISQEELQRMTKRQLMDFIRDHGIVDAPAPDPNEMSDDELLAELMRSDDEPPRGGPVNALSIALNEPAGIDQSTSRIVASVLAREAARRAYRRR